MNWNRTLPIHAISDLRHGDLSQVGAKLARLGELSARGYNVPSGFVVPVEDFESAVPDSVRRQVEQLLCDAPSDLNELQITAQKARAMIEQQPFPVSLVAELHNAYARLAEQLGMPTGSDVPTSVRSSALSEDGDNASYAGQFDTYLGIRGVAAIQEHIKKCWGSQCTARALDYRRRTGQKFQIEGIGVGVLALVDARVAGIVFSIDPVSGEEDRIVIEANWGLGDSVVSGRVTPDRWVVSKSNGSVTDMRIADKKLRSVWRQGGHSAIDEPVPQNQRQLPCLTSDEVRMVVETTLSMEQQEGCPQDVEWAIANGQEPPASLVLLQHRPITTVATTAKIAPFDPVKYALREVFRVRSGQGNER